MQTTGCCEEDYSVTMIKDEHSLSSGDPVAMNISPLKTYGPGQNQVSEVKKNNYLP